MASQNFRIKNGISVGENGTILTTSDNGNIGIGSTNPSSKLSVVGDANISGIITANKFVGDGSLLLGVIGIGSGVGISSGGQNIGIASQINFSSSFFVQPPNNGIVNVQSNLTLDDIVAIGSVTSNSISVGDIVSNGDVFAYSFVGDGSNLTGISTGLIAQSIVSGVSNSSLGISGISTYTKIQTLNYNSDSTFISGTYGSDDYGKVVRCSGDGKLLYISAPHDRIPTGTSYNGTPIYYSGLIYAYELNSTGFNLVGIISGPVSYPTFYSGGTFNRMAYPRFGITFDCTYDGKRLFIEDEEYYVNNTYIYDRVTSFGSTQPTFKKVGIISATSLNSSSTYSFATKSNASGNLIYYYNTRLDGLATGYVYALRNSGNNYAISGIVTALTVSSGGSGGFGELTCDAAGDVVYVSYGSSVHVFDRTANWDGTSTFNKVGILSAYLPSPSNGSGDTFGSSLACSADGKTLFVGSSTEEVIGIGTTVNYGAVYVFDRVGNNFIPVTVLTGSDPNAYNYTTVPNYMNQTFPAIVNDAYGSSVACSFDGNILAVGAPFDELPGTNDTSSGETGIVYVYNRQGNSFNLVSTLVGPPSEFADNHYRSGWFGDENSLCVNSNGRTIVVGARYADPGGSPNNGEAYVYEQQRTTLLSTSSSNIGIGTTNPTSKLSVVGDANFSGIVTALGGFNIGIQSGGVNIATGVVTAFNFIGSGTSVSYNSNTKTVSVTLNSSTPNIPTFVKSSVQGTTSSIGIGSAENLTLSASKSYILHKVGVSTAAWVRLYTDQTSRTSDASRLETADPNPGSGVIAEVITTGISTVLMTPGVIGFNNDDPVTSNVYLAVTNKGTSTQAITVTLNYVPLEV